jgi:hypothetical protein
MSRFLIQYLLLLTSIGLLSGCSFEPYYQFFTIDVERAEKLTDGLVYQDERCSLIYNLWGDGGNAQFQFKNNSESDLIMDRHFLYIKVGFGAKLNRKLLYLVQEQNLFYLPVALII